MREYVVKDMKSGDYYSLESPFSCSDINQACRFSSHLRASYYLSKETQRIIPVEVTKVPEKQEATALVSPDSATHELWAVRVLWTPDDPWRYVDNGDVKTSTTPVPMREEEAHELRGAIPRGYYMLPVRVTTGEPSTVVRECME